MASNAKSKSGPPTAAQKRLAAERAAAARERIAVAQRRRRLMVIIGAIGVIVVVIAAFVVVKVVSGNSKPESGKQGAAAPTSISASLAAIPAADFNQVGTGTTTGPPEAVSAAALTKNGKPSLLYVGAEFCPYCAGERWPLVVALSRFGTFSNLGETFSSPSDVYPNTATLSFHGASYASKYISFAGKEVQSNQVEGNSYAPLDKLDAQQSALFSKAQGYPYLNLGGKYVLNQVQYDVGLLKGKKQSQIASAIANPSTAISKGVLGSANVLSARICQLTKQQPTSVCSSSGVQAAAKALKAK